MNGLVNRLGQLEARFERLVFQMQALYAQVQALATQIAGVQQQTGGGQSSGGSGIYIMAGVVIAAGSSVTGATVDWVIGGTGVVASTNATVWNMMESATISGKTIVLGMNPDGSFTVITQSC